MRKCATGVAMTDKPELVLPVYADGEFTAKCNKHTLELADMLLKTMNEWAKSYLEAPDTERPTAAAIGQAAYVAAWRVANHGNVPDFGEAVLTGHLNAMIQNDPKIKLALTTYPPTPN